MFNFFKKKEQPKPEIKTVTKYKEQLTVYNLNGNVMFQLHDSTKYSEMPNKPSAFTKYVKDWNNKKIKIINFDFRSGRYFVDKKLIGRMNITFVSIQELYATSDTCLNKTSLSNDGWYTYSSETSFADKNVKFSNW